MGLGTHLENLVEICYTVNAIFPYFHRHSSAWWSPCSLYHPPSCHPLPRLPVHSKEVFLWATGSFCHRQWAGERETCWIYNPRRTGRYALKTLQHNTGKKLMKNFFFSHAGRTVQLLQQAEANNPRSFEWFSIIQGQYSIPIPVWSHSHTPAQGILHSIINESE